MKWSNCEKMKVLLSVFVAVIMLCGGSTRADFTFGEPVNLGSLVNCEVFNCAPCVSANDLEIYYSCSPAMSTYMGDILVAIRETADAPFSEPASLGSNINSSRNEMEPTISANGLELYFVRGYEYPSILVAKRSSKEESWGAPIALSELGYAREPDISLDGLELYFSSDRLDGYGGWDVWMTRRESLNSPWQEPVNLGPGINSSYDETGPSISSDGLTLFYTWGSVIMDICMAKREVNSDTWFPAVNLCSMSFRCSSYDCSPSISKDGSALYFHSGRPGGCGELDLWQAPIIPIVDFNSDTIIDTEDLMILLHYWGTRESLCDIGPIPLGNGIVDMEDLKVFIEYWEQENMPQEMEDVE